MLLLLLLLLLQMVITTARLVPTLALLVLTGKQQQQQQQHCLTQHICMRSSTAPAAKQLIALNVKIVLKHILQQMNKI